MRLDKHLSHATGASRSLAHQWLRAKRVTVDGVVCMQAALQLSANAQVCLDGELVTIPQDGYWLLHKPAGFVCANTDGHYPTVIDLVRNQLSPQGLQIVGRLDADTTGMVLLTTDGQWNHQVTAPKKHCQKIYRVLSAAALTVQDCELLSAGILLQGEDKPCLPAEVFTVAEREYLIAICEGKYHQIKRMLAAVHNKVVRLHRLAVGGVLLADLPEGQFRPLTSLEVKQLANNSLSLSLAQVAQTLQPLY